MKVTRLLAAVVIAFTLLLSVVMSLLSMPRPGLAQGSDITITKSLNRSSNVVRVGEVLSFTIAVTNNSAFTLGNVTLLDNYDQTIMAFAGAVPLHSVHVASSGMITWNNVATPVIPPGQGIRVTVAFTVEHAKPATVNQAEGKDIRDDQGGLLNGADTSETQDAIGGNAPILKMIWPITATPLAGLPVTFTHIISNDGAALMTFLPLTDTYDPAFLQFHSAVPTPTVISPGLLVWTDLTTYFGDLPPFYTIVVTTVFTATTQVVTTVNQASTQGAKDEYNNNLTGGVALVPILIIADATPTPTSSPTPTATPDKGTDNDNNKNDDDDDDDDDNDNDDDEDSQPMIETATPIPTPTLPATIVAATEVVTNSDAPRYLPATGERSSHGLIDRVAIFMLFLILGLGCYYLWRRKLVG